MRDREDNYLKLKTLVLALLSISLTSSLLGATETILPPPTVQSIPGAGSYGASNMEIIDGIGQVKLNRTLVNTLHLIGTLMAESAKIGRLSLTGDANLTNSTIREESSISGTLHTQNTTFEKPLSLVLQRAVFIRSKLQGVRVLENMGFKGKQVLELRQGTLVHGPIVFEGGKGEIHIYSGSQVLGTVTGGKIIRK